MLESTNALKWWSVCGRFTEEFMIRCRLDFICRATSSGILKKPAFFREAKKSKNLKFYFYKSNEIYCKQGRFIEGSILALESMFLSSGMANKAGERTSLRFLETASLQMCLFVQISTMTRLQSLKVAILWAWFSYCLLLPILPILLPLLP